MTPGRDMDAAVARAMGCDLVAIGSEWRCDCIGYVHNSTPSASTYLRHLSTTDAVALAQCVPWLRGKGYAVTIEYDAEGIRVSAMPINDEGRADGQRESRYVDVPEAPNGLASALCQVVLAVAGGE